MSRRVVVRSFGGPEVLDLEDLPETHAGNGQLRVRVAAAGLNPMDWIIVGSAEAAEMFGVTTPAGFGYDFAGTIDEVGDGITGWSIGDRVFGGAMSRAVADFAIVDPAVDEIVRTPGGIDDVSAAAIAVAGNTAAAAIDAINVREGETVLIGGAAGGVGLFAVQLARLAGARVIGTGSEASFDFLRSLGAEPLQYGDGIVDRVRAAAPDGIDAAADLFGTEVAEVALRLGLAPERISTIAAPGSALPVKKTGGMHAARGTALTIANHIAAGRMSVPVAATFQLEQIRVAVQLQASRHVRGKIVITM